jgi:uncharacterized protein YneF (UPF0154 family)
MQPLIENPADPVVVAAPSPDENTPALEQNAPEFATQVQEPVATALVPSKPGEKTYPSLYDTLPTTIAAIAIGVGIIGGIQWTVRKIFSREKADHKALTQFVTSMFALIVGVWIADKLIAGPSTELLEPSESSQLLTFIKDITLMVFSYYFGTKAQVPNDESDLSGGE